MAPSNKTLKEEFVSGLAGGTISEINYVTAVAPEQTAVALWSALQLRFSFFIPYTLPAFILDFLLQCCAILAATTIYSSQPLTLVLSLLLPAIILLLTASSSSKSKVPSKPPSTPATPSSSDFHVSSPPKPQSFQPPTAYRPFLTNYRGTMMIVTCLSILSVDFRIFPRRFAKVETWGTSLMDMGVGSFVYSAGVVSAGPLLKSRASQTSSGLATRLRSAARHSFPLLVLGLVRLYSVKGLDYAEHVSEYGVHWNFFFTLGLLPPLVALFQSILTIVPSQTFLALALVSGYQFVLENTSLKAYILISARIDLLSQNREGIFSLVGYLAIFLLGQASGLSILSPSPPIPGLISALSRLSPVKPVWARRLRVNPSTRVLLNLAVSSALYIALFQVTHHYRGLGLAVSRRLANLPYVLWVAAFNSVQLSAFCIVDTIFHTAKIASASPSLQQSKTQNQKEESVSLVLRAFNRNGLALFLFANLGTGVVNLSLDTIALGTWSSMAVLVAYAAVLTVVAVGLEMRGLVLKL
ncbi:MAG: Glucosaminyl phosphatidylinositol (GlcN-PI) nositol acylation protein [Vezdaea aestivalis]|nr:MAG: Glucosaminyl phosphatidylinositol (GlcN-PI) nositol acylation protein [Vezdaea aestivalis]